jgi:hypothetical protein
LKDKINEKILIKKLAKEKNRDNFFLKKPNGDEILKK